MRYEYKLCLVLCILMTSAFLFDLGLSYVAFQDNPQYFVEKEVNEYVAKCFMNGDIPYLFLTKIPMYCFPAILIFYGFVSLSDTYKKQKEKFSEEGYKNMQTYLAWVIYGAVLYHSFIAMASFAAPFTWFDGENMIATQLNIAMHMNANISIVGILIISFLILGVRLKEKRKSDKESITDKSV